MPAGETDEPLLFLDVDGTLLPFAARTRPLAAPVAPPGDAGNPLLDRLDPADGRRLSELGCRLVWATTWSAEANEVLTPRLGLPDLPVVAWPEEDDETIRGLHWKTVSLTRWAAGRRFVWLDDEITPTDRRWVSDHHPGKALLHRVDPRTGLTATDFGAVRSWLDATHPGNSI